MNKRGLVIVFAFVFLTSFICAQSLPPQFNTPTDESLDSFHVGETYFSNAEYDLANLPSIESLSLDFSVSLAKQDSYVKIVLVGGNGEEYLVYLAGFPLEDYSDFVDVCEETCTMNSINPAKLVIEISGDGTSLDLKNINYLTNEKKFLDGTDADSIHKDQADFKLSELLKKNLSWLPEITTLSYLSYKEKENKLGGWFGATCGFEFYGGQGIFSFCEEENQPYVPNKAYNDLFDWRNRHGEDWTTPVKDQSTCGSCSAFSVIGTFESVINTYFNQHLNYNLAEQDIVSCFLGNGCSGGVPADELEYIKNTGVVSESCFPYVARDEDDLFNPVYCSDRICDSDLYKLTNYNYIDSHDMELAIKDNLTKRGPLQMTGPMNLWDHAVVLIGYGYEDTFNYSYWIYKNSLGTSNPYGRLKVLDPDDLVDQTSFYYIDTPILPASQSVSRICEDSDLDGYCNWGTGDRPGVCDPDIGLADTGYDCCSSQCAPQEDCDDSLGAVTICSNEDLFCGGFSILPGGESSSFGSYVYGDDVACCGDDSDEFVSGGGCCDKPTDTFISGECIPDPRVDFYSDLNYPASDVNDEFTVALGSTVYFRAVGTSYGEATGVCTGCNFDWYQDEVLQASGSTEYSSIFNEPGIHSVVVNVTDFEGKSTSKGVYVFVAVNGIIHAGNQINPDVYGDRIVFQDDRNGNYDIYSYDIMNGIQTQITSGVENQELPKIYGNLIAYEDYRNGDSDIYFYNLSSRVENKLVSSDLAREKADIYVNKFVYEDKSMLNPKVNYYNLSSQVEIPLATSSEIRGDPKISGNIVVWGESTFLTDFDIFMYNLSSSTETALVSAAGIQRYPNIDGNYVVWEDTRNANYDIYLYNLIDGSQTQITADSFDQRHPEIYGNLIAYEDYRNGDSDIYYYNISSGVTQRVTYEGSDQVNPRIYGNYIVWEDYRNGDADIYFLDLSGEVHPNLDINSDERVNVLDLALLIFNQGRSGAEYSHLNLDGDGDIDWNDVLICVKGF